MPSFEPRNDDHAIVSVVWMLELTRAIDAGLLVSMGGPARAELPWAKDLPAFAPLGQFAISTPGGPAPMAAMGAQFAFLKPDGQPRWALRLVGNTISVECTTYTRWQPVWEQADRYLRQAFEVVSRSQADVELVSTSLQYQDSFVANGETYNLEELIAGRKLVGSVPFENGNLWHVYVGWFDPISDYRLLHNLNVQGTGVTPQGGSGQVQGPPYSVTVTHFQQIRHSEDKLSHFEEIDGFVARMHARNKEVMADLIAYDMAVRIGLVLA